MSPAICLFLLTTCALISKVISARHATPTKGEIWPRPAQQVKYDAVYSYKSDNFKYEIQEYSCKLLHQAISRTWDNINNIEVIAKKLQKYGHVKVQQEVFNNEISVDEQSTLRALDINLKSPCEEYPQADMDESYSLDILTTSQLSSNSVWGIIRGLETFSQMFYLSDNYKEVLINGTHIEDYPQYPHRGLLLDTSRHFLSVDTILKTLDAMAMNKMNVFHWHIVDEESFPYQSEKFPELSAQGAYHPLLVYTKSNIQQIIQYAKVRGIRVMPEFDGPGHVTSWAKSHPDVISNCSFRPPLNPIKRETYNLLRGLYKEVQELFPEKYFHLGGDEVNTDCWNEDADINDYMKKHNIKDPNQLNALFFERTLPLLKDGTTPIVWEEAFFGAKTSLAPNTAIQVWGWNWETKMKDNNPERQINSILVIQVQGYDWKNKISKILLNKYRVIFSSYWYLDYKVSEHNFDDFYGGDPRAMMAGSTDNKTLMNIPALLLIRQLPMWPRASAIAEVLWSYTGGIVPNDAFNRIEEHKCRMNRFGVGAEPPSGPGFCITQKNIAFDSFVNG